MKKLLKYPLTSRRKRKKDNLTATRFNLRLGYNKLPAIKLARLIPTGSCYQVKDAARWGHMAGYQAQPLQFHVQVSLSFLSSKNHCFFPFPINLSILFSDPFLYSGWLVIWWVLKLGLFCMFCRITTGNFCRNPYNVTGICNRSSCPLANSRYATIRDHDGNFHLPFFLFCHMVFFFFLVIYTYRQLNCYYIDKFGSLRRSR